MSPCSALMGINFTSRNTSRRGRKLSNLLADFQEAIFAPIDEVHFVHRNHNVRNAEQRRDVSVPTRLLDDALPRIHEHDGKVCRRSAGDHVARVLHVAGRVRDDELAFGRRKIAIRDIDRDALLAFGAQAVGEIREIDLPPPVMSALRSSASIWSSIRFLES